MSRWIEVETLIDLSIPVLCGGGNEEMAVLVEDIDSAPSIEIIRCGECKWFDSGKNDSEIWSMCTRHFGKYIDVNADDFCSYGERNCSEKPNNCDTCKWGEWYRNGRDITNMDDECGGCCSWNSKWTPKTEPTISKMEQVEPQTCSFSDCDNFKNPDYERCIECKRKQIKLKTEQTEVYDYKGNGKWERSEDD